MKHPDRASQQVRSEGYIIYKHNWDLLTTKKHLIDVNRDMLCEILREKRMAFTFRDMSDSTAVVMHPGRRKSEPVTVYMNQTTVQSFTYII